MSVESDMSAPASIRLHDIQVFRNDKAVLDGANMTLTAGERLAVVGPNGAGKTTLLRTVIGLEPAVGGRVTLFGEVCRSEAEFRKQRPRIGFLFQESDDQLFCPTVIEDVAFGPCNLGMSDAQARERAAATLSKLGIAALADRFTHRLSGGEKRLVCLAGLLAMEPDVLLLDEPTNGVDKANGERLRTALHEFGGAILLVSHDERFVMEMANRVLVLTAGKLVAAQLHDHLHLHQHQHPHIHVDAATVDDDDHHTSTDPGSLV